MSKWSNLSAAKVRSGLALSLLAARPTEAKAPKRANAMKGFIVGFAVLVVDLKAVEKLFDFPRPFPCFLYFLPFVTKDNISCNFKKNPFADFDRSYMGCVQKLHMSKLYQSYFLGC